MSITPLLLLEKVSKILAETPPELPDDEKEVIYRIVVSRAYYAAFWAAQDYLLEKEGAIVENNAHHHIRLAFRSRKPPESTVHDRLKRMFEDRVRADYSPQDTVTEEHATVALARGRDVFRLLAQMTQWLRQRNPLP